MNKRLVEYSAALKLHPNNLEVKKEYIKRCYELYMEAGIDEAMLYKISNYEGVSVESIKCHAREYRLSVLGISDEEFYKQYVVEKKKYARENHEDRESLFAELLNNLMLTNDRNEIIQLFEQYKCENGYVRMRDKASIYICHNFPEQKYLIEEFNKKLEIYLDYKKGTRKKMIMDAKNRLIEEETEELKKECLAVKDYVIEFIDGNYLTVYAYVTEKGILIADFEKMLAIVKKCDKELYQRYLEKLEKNKMSYANDKLDKIKELIKLLKEGIVLENGEKRNFDIIDYCQFIDMDLDTLDKTSRACKLNFADLKVIKCFIGTNIWKCRDNDINVIMEALQEIDCKRDKNGKLVPGTGRIIEASEKIQIIEFMQSIGVPVNTKNYYIAFRRYVAGTLFNEKEDCLVRSKVKNK